MPVSPFYRIQPMKWLDLLDTFILRWPMTLFGPYAGTAVREASVTDDHAGKANLHTSAESLRLHTRLMQDYFEPWYWWW